MGPLFSFFLIHIDGLPKITDNDAKVVLFADDTSIVVINFNQGGFPTILNKILSGIISWLKPISHRSALIKHII